MAEDVCVLEKNCKITVRVDEVLPDIVVVSFTFQGKLFQGVLLDSSKKLLPCGIVPPSHELPPLGTAVPPLEDRLFSASQRYTYYQTKTLEGNRQQTKPNRIKTAPMTVRLRPRQVLCSKCKGICNENSENVDFSAKKRKVDDVPEDPRLSKLPRVDRRLRSSRGVLNAPEEDDHNNTSSTTTVDTKADGSERVQKIRIVGRWKKNNVDKRNDDDDNDDNDDQMCNGDQCVIDSLSDNNAVPIRHPLEVRKEIDGAESKANSKRLLRKKRSVGSMEDLWDETVFEDSAARNVEKKTKTPVIKISFGSATGEGTIVEIPAKEQTLPTEVDNSVAENSRGTRDASAKAARKALKKAKKEARKKMGVGCGSPGACSSPRYSCLSPRYLVGSASPLRPAITPMSPACEVLRKKHKHKVKHKKRHKEEKLSPPQCSPSESVITPDTIRECLKQKLSISLKRLSATAYTPRLSCSPTASDEEDADGDAGVPDFPNPNPTVLMRLAATAPAQPIRSCQTSDGRLMAVGDVVWGKIHGFPWWPGKVIAITVSRKDDGVCCPPQAHVAWYGSSTSSLISCDQLNPFLETFQIRYNKRKRGPYKEAIKQATTEAKRGDVHISPDIYLSPEVDVAS